MSYMPKASERVAQRMAVLRRRNPAAHAKAVAHAKVLHARGIPRTKALASGLARVGFGDVKATGVNLTPIATTIVCDASGQFTQQNGQWVRLAPGQVCGQLTGTAPGHAGTGGGGVAVTETVCAPPAAGLAITVPQFPDVQLVVSPNEGEGAAYKFFCTDPSIVGLTRAQKEMVVFGIRGGSQAAHRGILDAFTGDDRTDIGNAIRGYTGEVAKDVLNGNAAIYQFTGPDGDTKNLFVTVEGDPNNPSLTFRWWHQKTLFQSVDSFLEALSPVSTEQICQMLPVASKVPNPYVAIGSVVLQMSGKCPPSCPTGMLYDANTKTCACPPGSQFNAATNRCEVVGGGMSSWLLPAALIGGGALLILALNKKKASSP